MAGGTPGTILHFKILDWDFPWKINQPIPILGTPHLLMG